MAPRKPNSTARGTAALEVVDGFKPDEDPLAPAGAPDALEPVPELANVSVVPLPLLPLALALPLALELTDTVVEPDAELLPATIVNSSLCARIPLLVGSVEMRSTR